MWRAPAVISALVASLALAPAAAGSPGDLDGSFSDHGWLRTLEVRSAQNNYLPRVAEDVAVQPDGRIVAVGELIDGTSNWDFGAFRYLPNGELDPSFGEGGWVDTDFGSFEFPHAVAVQPDGGILVAGEGDCRYAMCFVLARYRPDGSLDPGFGEGGIVRSPFGLVQASHAFDLSLAPDGRIVAAGFVQKGGDAQDSSHFAVARYLPDGRFDPSFSRDGRATVDFGYGNDIAYGLAVRGRSIIATGSTVVAPERAPSLALTRLTWGGGLAPGFGRRRVRPGPGGGIGRAVLAAPNGRILVGGRAYSDTSQDASDWALLRYTRGGRLDRGFGGDGIVVTDFGTGEDSVRALALDRGRIGA